MKGTAKIFVIISMIACALSGLSSIFMSDVMLELFRDIFQQIAVELTIDINQFLNILKTYITIMGVIELVASLAVGTYALWALKKGKSKRSLIAPGVLLILFNGLFGIIAAIIMFCVKPEEFEQDPVEIIQ